MCTVENMNKKVVFSAFFAVSVYFLNDYMNGCKYQSDTRLDGKVIIVTGANTGIGKETVIDFVLRGAKVYMGCRSLERGQRALDDIRGQTGVSKDLLVLLELDLASLASVRKFAQGFKQREDKLDILVNNAGIMMVPYIETEDGFELTFATNHLGHFLLTNLLMNHMVSAAPSRVVTVSAIGYRWATMNFDDLMGKKEYSASFADLQSKLANVLFARELAKRLEGTGVTSYSLHPGPTMTEIGRHIPVLNLPVINQVAHFLMSPFLKDPWHGARTTVFCSIEPGIEGYSGKYFSDCALEELTDEAKDDDVARRLWDVSVDLVTLQPGESHPVLRA